MNRPPRLMWSVIAIAPLLAALWATSKLEAEGSGPGAQCFSLYNGCCKCENPNTPQFTCTSGNPTGVTMCFDNTGTDDCSSTPCPGQPQ